MTKGISFSFKENLNLQFVSMCVFLGFFSHPSLCTTCVPGACEGQEGAADPLGQES